MKTFQKALGAGAMISIGSYGILAIDNKYISAFLFTLGLLTICKLKLNLFTGKCGFIFESKKWGELGITLVGNLLIGYLLGLAYSTVSSDIYNNAVSKVATWNIDIGFFIRSMLCGVLMYIAVKLYQAGTVLGILLGIPLFILCGFQHCIANVVYMGAARTFDFSLLVAIVGNMCGSLFIWLITREMEA